MVLGGISGEGASCQVWEEASRLSDRHKAWTVGGRVGLHGGGGGEEGKLGKRQASHGLDLVAVNRMIE